MVKIWPPMASRTSLAMEPKTRLAVGVSKETSEPGIIHRSAIQMFSQCMSVYILLIHSRGDLPNI